MSDTLYNFDEVKMTEKCIEKDLALKIVRQRFSDLEMAEALGNVSEACRRGGVDRTSFSEWKQRYRTRKRVSNSILNR